MPLTKLDTIAALVVVDLQKFVLGMPTMHPVGEVIGRTVQLVAAFRGRGLPIVLVRVTGAYPGGRTESGVSKTMPPGAWSEPIPEMESRPEDLIVYKPRADAIIGSSLEYD
jgi:nicotinamidase-related amidase